MNCIQLFLALALFCSSTIAFMKKFSQIYVDDFHISKCNPGNSEPITLENVEIQVDEHNKVHVSGTLIASEDLSEPIAANVVIKRSTWIGWIPVVCVDNVGSCTFKDVCKFGYPKDEDCPETFKDNKVPCRCPIKEGNYTLPPSLLDYMNEKSVLSGKYKGSVTLSHFNDTLACYNMYFSLKDKLF